MAQLLPGKRLAGDREILWAFAVIARLAYFRNDSWALQCALALGGSQGRIQDNSAQGRPSLALLQGDDWQIIAIEGTTTGEQWLANVSSANQVTDPDMPGKVHAGFLAEFAGIYGQLRAEIEAGGERKVIVVGHSLGGALASFTGHMCEKRYPERLAYVVTFGEPRNGDEKHSNATKFRKFRLGTSGDIVPTVPPASYMFQGNQFPPIAPVELKWQHSGNFQCLFLSATVKDNYGGSNNPVFEVPDPFSFNALWFGANSAHQMSTYMSALGVTFRPRRPWPFNRFHDVANEMQVAENLPLRYVHG